jgi:hypothetical protein
MNDGKNGASAHEFVAQIGVTYKTACFMMLHLREAMIDAKQAADAAATCKRTQLITSTRPSAPRATKKAIRKRHFAAWCAAEPGPSLLLKKAGSRLCGAA